MSRTRGRRSGRRGIQDLSPILAAIHECRDAAVRVQTNYPIKSDAYRAARALNAVLDDLSEALTGDRRAHWPFPKLPE